MAVDSLSKILPLACALFSRGGQWPSGTLREGMQVEMYVGEMGGNIASNGNPKPLVTIRYSHVPYCSLCSFCHKQFQGECRNCMRVSPLAVRNTLGRSN